jgi:hypothetical protein
MRGAIAESTPPPGTVDSALNAPAAVKLAALVVVLVAALSEGWGIAGVHPAWAGPALYNLAAIVLNPGPTRGLSRRSAPSTSSSTPHP